MILQILSVLFITALYGGFLRYGYVMKRDNKMTELEYVKYDVVIFGLIAGLAMYLGSEVNPNFGWKKCIFIGLFFLVKVGKIFYEISEEKKKKRNNIKK